MITSTQVQCALFMVISTVCVGWGIHCGVKQQLKYRVQLHLINTELLVFVVDNVSMTDSPSNNLALCLSRCWFDACFVRSLTVFLFMSTSVHLPTPSTQQKCHCTGSVTPVLNDNLWDEHPLKYDQAYASLTLLENVFLLLFLKLCKFVQQHSIMVIYYQAGLKNHSMLSTQICTVFSVP